MDGVGHHSKSDLEEFELLLNRHLQFYEDLRTGRRRVRTRAQRDFIDVVRGLKEPTTAHEKAYLFHLAREGRAVARKTEALPSNLQPNPHDTGKKWSDAEKNMSGWRPWHD